MACGQTTMDVMIMAGFNNINTAIWELMVVGINQEYLTLECMVVIMVCLWETMVGL